MRAFPCLFRIGLEWRVLAQFGAKKSLHATELQCEALYLFETVSSLFGAWNFKRVVHKLRCPRALVFMRVRAPTDSAVLPALLHTEMETLNDRLV